MSPSPSFCTCHAREKAAISTLAWKKHSNIFYLEGVSLWSDLLWATNSCFFLTSVAVFSIISNLISSASRECFRYLHFSTTCLPFSLLKLASTMFWHGAVGPSTLGQWQHKHSCLLYSLSFGLCPYPWDLHFPPYRKSMLLLPYPKQIWRNAFYYC